MYIVFSQIEGVLENENFFLDEGASLIFFCRRFGVTAFFDTTEIGKSHSQTETGQIRL